MDDRILRIRIRTNDCDSFPPFHPMWFAGTCVMFTGGAPPGGTERERDIYCTVLRYDVTHCVERLRSKVVPLARDEYGRLYHRLPYPIIEVTGCRSGRCPPRLGYLEFAASL